MNDHDIQLLAVGAAGGMHLMLLVQIVFGVLDDRRDRKVARDAAKRAAGAAFLISFRAYRSRNRSQT